MAKNTLWLLEDQLCLKLIKPGDTVLMIESLFAFRMWRFHKKRLVFLIASMRHFRDELRSRGIAVHYHALDDEPYGDSISALKKHIKDVAPGRIDVVLPADHHTKRWIDSLDGRFGVPIHYRPNSLFLIDRDEFSHWARGLKSPVMEGFYRRMRVKHRVLMDGDKPAGGRWNFDKQNRRSAPGALLIPQAKPFTPDQTTIEVMALVDRLFADHPGSCEGFNFPVTAADAREALKDFIDHRLPEFGDYEDAMLSGQPLLYHSRLSAVINNGLLEPIRCIQSAEKAWKAGQAPLNAVEGFIRQILGWREYMHGIYWTFMPEYRDRNSRNDTVPLPDFFWNAQTDMNCLRQTIGDVLQNAYSHHIQRLMVICNFATLMGLNPQAVNDWFLEMYVDSHDWVVTPNVIGMGMNADGGTCATKPYVSSAAYINRMSDYCKGCRFNPAHRVGDDACPFNYLYWTFLQAHREKLQKNPRMNMLLKNIDKFGHSELVQMQFHRDKLLADLRPVLYR